MFVQSISKKYKDNTALIKSSASISHKSSPLFKCRYFQTIFSRDNQLMHDNWSQVIRCINQAMLNVGQTFLADQPTQGLDDKGDKFKILLFPIIIEYLKAQVVPRNTANRRAPFALRKLWKHKKNMADKDAEVLKTKVSGFLCSLVIGLNQHIQSFGTPEAREAFESTLIYRLFISPEVSSKFANEQAGNNVRSTISAALDAAECACLVSALDSNNADNYAKGIVVQLAKYFEVIGGVKFNNTIDKFINTYILNNTGIKPSLEQIDTREAMTKAQIIENRREICYALYIWYIISMLAYSATKNIPDFNIAHVRALKTNTTYEKQVNNLRDFSTTNHMLISTEAAKARYNQTQSLFKFNPLINGIIQEAAPAAPAA